MKINQIDFSHYEGDGQLWNEINNHVLRTSNPELISSGLQLLAENPDYQVFFIENPKENSIKILNINQEDFFYVAFNSGFEYDSSGVLVSNTANRENRVTLNFRYLVIYKEVREILLDKEERWRTNGLVKFLTDPYGLFDEPSDIKLTNLKKRIYETHSTIKLYEAQIKDLEAKDKDKVVSAEYSRLKGQHSYYEKQLNQLRWQYDQLMLSKVVKGSDNNETSAWWINRY